MCSSRAPKLKVKVNIDVCSTVSKLACKFNKVSMKLFGRHHEEPMRWMSENLYMKVYCFREDTHTCRLSNQFTALLESHYGQFRIVCLPHHIKYIESVEPTFYLAIVCDTNVPT